jgi:hypothetical protein
MEIRFKVGDEVRIHPATDQFMMGIRYADITLIGRKWIHLYSYRHDYKFKVSYNYAFNYFMNRKGDLIYPESNPYM